MFKGVDNDFLKYIFEQFKNHSMTVIAFVFAGLYFYSNYTRNTEKDEDCEKKIKVKNEMVEFWKTNYYEIKSLKKEISVQRAFKKINDSIK